MTANEFLTQELWNKDMTSSSNKLRWKRLSSSSRQNTNKKRKRLMKDRVENNSNQYKKFKVASLWKDRNLRTKIKHST